MSYWKELSKTSRYFSVGKEGWQVEVCYENGRGQVINKHWHRNKELTADLKLQMQKERIVAEASVDREDYRRLLSRIEDENWPHILSEPDLRGAALNKWLTETPTSDEFMRHMRYG
jgi:hypothetical protein